MPRVEPQRRRGLRGFLLSSTAVLTILGSTLGWTGLSLVKPAAALASSTLPDPALTDKPLFLILEQSNGGGNINAPDDYAKIYFDPTTVNPSVEIFNSQFNPCGSKAAGYDYTSAYTVGPCPNTVTDANEAVEYDFYNTDNQETPTGLLLSLNGNDGTNAVTGTPVIAPVHSGWTAPVPLGVTSPISLKTGYKVVYVHAHFLNPLASSPWSIKSHGYQFRTTNANDSLGFVDDKAPLGSKPPDGQVIVHTITPGVDGYEVNFELDFAPSCDVITDQNVALRWSDADNFSSPPAGGTDGNDFPGDTNPSFTFYQIPPVGPQIVTTIFHWKNGARSNPDIGGNNDYNELPFTAHPGWKYRWAWNSVNSAWNNFTAAANNIQMWLPYDSINYNVSCWNYHSQIAPSDGKVNGQILDFSNPANRQVSFNLKGSNSGNGNGPAGAVLDPRATLGVGGPSAGPLAVRQPGTWSNPLPAISAVSSVPGGQVSFQLPATVPTGTVLCFGDTISPHTKFDPAPFPNDPPDICYTVKNDVRFPSIIGQNSDIHADGGTCIGAPTSGNIAGQPSATSYGDYVVSAAGVMSDFESNSRAGTGTELNLGKFGSYANACRADLFTIAENHFDPASMVRLAGGAYNLAALPPNPSGVYFFTGPVSLSGQVNAKTTLVVESGDVAITADIKLTNAPSTPYQVPSLGIITSPGSNIIIHPAATQVDAYLFGGANIDTCAFVTNVRPPGCDNTLVVHGFLMAKSLGLNRLGPNTIVPPQQTAEQIVMNPQLYLNPPTFFDAQGAGTQLLGLGEKPPLY